MLLFLLLLSGCGLTSPTPSSGDSFAVQLRDLDQHHNGSETAIATSPGNSIAQSFRPNRDNLNRVEIQLKSFPAPLPANGTFTLRGGGSPDGPILRTLSLADADFSANPYLAFSFQPVSGSAGQQYTLVLNNPNAPLSRSISVQMSDIDSYSAGMALIDGQPLPGDLNFRTSYNYTPATLLGDIWQALADHWWLALIGVAFLLLPGLALGRAIWAALVGPRLLAAPGITLLIWPVLLLLLGTIGVRIGAFLAWALLALAVLVLIWLASRRRAVVAVADVVAPELTPVATTGTLPVRRKAAPPNPNPFHSGEGATPDVATSTLPAAQPPYFPPAPVGKGLGVRASLYWLGLLTILLTTLISRLVPVRDLWAGMGLDAYHHTLVAQMFLHAGGLPVDYLPYAPLASFTYHFGFHAWVAALDWLAPGQLPIERLMVLTGQLAGTLPVLSLTLFGWRILGDRRLGIIAGALVGLVAIFPAFYLNWSRYTQGLGLALLPVALVVLFDAVKPFLDGDRKDWRRHLPGLLLASFCCAGLFLTHYRIFGMLASYSALLFGGIFLRRIIVRRGADGVAQSLRGRLAPILPLAGVAVVTGLLILPWLLNMAANFRSRFTGSADASNAGYYDLGTMLGDVPRQFWSTTPLIGLAGLGLAWCVVRGKWPGVALAVWFGFHYLWSNPTAFLAGLPGVGFIDTITVVTSAYIPICLLAAYPILGLWRLIVDLPTILGRLLRREWRANAWRPVAIGLLGILSLLALIPAGAGLLTILDIKPYITSADKAGMDWLRENAPADALVLGSGFGPTWGPVSVQGSDASLWTPVLAGVRSTLPPVPAYNERPSDPAFLEQAVDIVRTSVTVMRTDATAAQQQEAWSALRAIGVTYVFVGSRGGVLDGTDPGMTYLLNRPEYVSTVFHQDDVWIFQLR